MSQKRARPTSPITGIDGRDDASEEGGDLVVSDDEDERTLSDPPVAMEVEGVVAESSAHRTVASPFQLDFRRVGLLLKAIKALGGVASKREALPTVADLNAKTVWTDRRLRSLAVACKLNPPQGSKRKPLLKLISKFREEPVDLDLDEVPLQDAPLDTADVGLASDDNEDVARLRALEKSDLQIQVEEAERELARDVEIAAEKERAEVKEALAAVHASGMKALQERLDAAKREGPSRFPLLTASRTARMDKGVPRSVARTCPA
jgi:hypothetical protein